jgi:hypothetical protein
VTVAAHAQPIAVGSGGTGDANCLVYEIKNTSASRHIGSIVVALPCCQPGGVPHLLGWDLIAPISKTIALSGSGSAGCAVDRSRSATFNPGSQNGQIAIEGCSIAPGKILDVQFQVTNPESCDESWAFPSFLEKGDGAATSESWPLDQVILATVTGCLSGPTPAPRPQGKLVM